MPVGACPHGGGRRGGAHTCRPGPTGCAWCAWLRLQPPGTASYRDSRIRDLEPLLRDGLDHREVDVCVDENERAQRSLVTIDSVDLDADALPLHERLQKPRCLLAIGLPWKPIPLGCLRGIDPEQANSQLCVGRSDHDHRVAVGHAGDCPLFEAEKRLIGRPRSQRSGGSRFGRSRGGFWEIPPRLPQPSRVAVLAIVVVRALGTVSTITAFIGTMVRRAGVPAVAARPVSLDPRMPTTDQHHHDTDSEAACATAHVLNPVVNTLRRPSAESWFVQAARGAERETERSQVKGSSREKGPRSGAS